MGPRLRQIDELNQLGLTPEQEAILLNLPIKTVREYQYRLHQIDGEHRPRGWHGHTRHKTEPLLTEHDQLRPITSDGSSPAIPAARLSLDAESFYGRIPAANQTVETRKEGQMPEDNRSHLEDIHTVENPIREREERSVTSQVLEARRSEIDTEWREVVAFTTVEGAAAVNYWRGRAEEYNAFRDALVRQHPEREIDLPPALQVDEIQVRQVVLEQERELQKSAEIGQ